MPHLHNIIVMIMLSGIVSACSSINSQFDCPLKAGIRCESIDSVNARVDRGEIVSSSAALIPPSLAIAYHQEPHYLKQASFKNDQPLRTSETVMRVWFAPFEDREGNYHRESEIDIVAKPSSWLDALTQEKEEEIEESA